MADQNEPAADPSAAPPGFYQRESAYIRPTDTTGLVFMSIMAFFLLAALLRSEKRCRGLLARLAEAEAVKAYPPPAD